MAKLVLDIKPGVIKNAKGYADEVHADLSALVEDFLENIREIEKSRFGISKKTDTMEISETSVENTMPAKSNNIMSEDELPQWIKDLAVVTEPVPDFDNKAEYRKHIIEKYS